MADYQAEANSIYDPQLAAETSTAAQSRDATLASLNDAEKSTNTAYTSALDSATRARNDESARADFNASTHGLFSSGLQANQQRLIGDTYQRNVDQIFTNRANKLASIATSRSLAQSGYASKVGALTSKYQGLKAEYVAKGRAADAANAARIQAAQIREQGIASRSRASASNQQQDFNQALEGMFEGYDPHNKQQQWYTERVVIPTLAQQYGKPIDTIAKNVYSYRKAAFGE